MDQTAANDMANTKPVSNSDTSRSQWNDRMDQGLEPRSSTYLLRDHRQVTRAL